MKTTKKMMAGIVALLWAGAAFCAPGKKSVEELKKAKPAPESDFEVELTEDGKGVILTAYTGNIRQKLKWSDRIDLVIPATIQGYPVVAIGNGFAAKLAFVFRSVVIPEGVVSIGEAAFYGSKNLEVLVLPSTLRVIDKGAFMQQGQYAMLGDFSSLKELVIPEGVVGIGPGAFEGCYALTSLTLPKSLRFMGGRAFWGAYKLTSLEIPEDLQLLEYSWADDYGTLEYDRDPSNFYYEFFGSAENLAMQKRLRELTLTYPKSYKGNFEYWKNHSSPSVWSKYSGYTNWLQYCSTAMVEFR